MTVTIDLEALQAALARRLGHPFADPVLLTRALTHRSWCAEHDGALSNERLEFLGDAVLGLVVTDELFRRHPDLPEGTLSIMRSGLVSAEALEQVARTVDLGAALRLGKGEDATGGRDKRSILADSIEAVIGAVHLDGGIEAARVFVLDLLADRLAAAAAGPEEGNAKTRLQELAAHRYGIPPRYEVTSDGPDHARTYTALVRVDGKARGRGQGPSKKQAEQIAAAMACEALEALSDETVDRMGRPEDSDPEVGTTITTDKDPDA